MSDGVSAQLAPCLFCKTAAQVGYTHGHGWSPEWGAGVWVTCQACGLRGPWRRTAAQARAVWNRAVTAHIHPDEGQEK